MLYNIGKSAEHLEISPEFDPITGVEVYSKDGDAEPLFDSGDDTGRILKVVNPWVTSQAMADNILASVEGFEYQPFTAEGALLDPAAELGDGITVNGISSTIFKQDIEFSRLMKSDISAPHDEEVIHEYGGYVTPQERRYAREFAEIRAQLKIAADSISAEVVKKTGGNESHTFGWELTDDSWRIYNESGDLLTVSEDGFFFEGDGTFSGNVYAGNIQYAHDYSTEYMGTFDGYGLTGGTVGSGKTDSFINGALADALFSSDVFGGIQTADYCNATYLGASSNLSWQGNNVYKKIVVINGTRIAYLTAGTQ